MYRFIKNTIAFTFIILIFNSTLIVLDNKIYSGTYKKYSLDFHSYLLSDSHGYFLNNKTESFGVYNFSSNSDSYIDMKRKLHFLIKKTNIDTLFITVDDHTLSPYREDFNNLERSKYYTTIHDYDNFFAFVKGKIENKLILFQSKKKTIIKEYFIRKTKKFLFKQKTLPKKKKHEWPELTNEQRKTASRIRFKKQFPSNVQSKILSDALIDIINICKENKITLIGVRFPLSIDYANELGNTNFGASEILKINKIKVIDLKDVFYDNNNLFINPDHLNNEGASMFVKIFFNKIKKLQ